MAVDVAFGPPIAAFAEGEAAPDLVAFAKLLAADNLKLYGADWTQVTTNQLKIFEDGARYLNYVEAYNGDRTTNSTVVPTWIADNNDRVADFLTLDQLSSGTRIPIPLSSKPSFFPIQNQVVAKGSPFHVPIDAYDPNGNALTFTVATSQPSNVGAQVLENNQSARVTVDGYGEMIFELFNQDAPRPVNRFVTLARNGFYNTTATNSMTFHRASRDQAGNDFVIQGGDPLGTGRGGSTLGNFDDQFSLNLQHNRVGVLSYAKSFDDTNDSQFFITGEETRFLDYNHSIFGQLIEGDRTRAGINRIATDGNEAPLAPVVIRSVEIFNDTENGLLRLVALGAPGSTSKITVTARDTEGNEFSQEFTVTVADDTSNGSPFFKDFSLLNAVTNNPYTFQLPSLDQEGDQPWYSVSVGNATTVQAQFNSTTGEVVLTPNNGFVGKVDLQVIVARSPLSNAVILDAIRTNNSTLFDFQIISAQFDKPFSIATDAASTTEKDTSVTGRVTRPAFLGIASPLVITLTSSDPSKATVPATVTILANQTTATFAITPIDNSIVGGTYRATITGAALNNAETSSFDIFDDETPNQWHNVPTPFDVNNDGSVVPLDVLLIINQLSRLGTVLLPVVSQTVTSFVDTNNDYYLSPIDVLQVINFLNRRSPSGEGEAPASTTAQSSALSIWLSDEVTTLRNRRISDSRRA